MTEEGDSIPVVTDAAEVVTVSDSDDADGGGKSDEAAMETTRAQAEARRKRILEKANNRIKYVNGEQVQNEEEKKTSLSNAARIRAARQRRYGKKSAAAATPSTTTPAATTTTTPSAPEAETSATAETSTSTSAPDAEGDKAAEAPIETTASAEETTASASASAPTTKKKYVGVARMRRKMLVKKKMEEENNDTGASSTADNDSAKASLASNGKASKEKAVGSAASVAPPLKVQTVPIYMHVVIILLLFVAGFDVGVQQFHEAVDIRTQVAVREFGVPFVHRNPWNPPKPMSAGKDSKETLEEKLSSSSFSSTGDAEDEFEEIDAEYNPPNIDPIFRVDLDELTKGPGFLNQMARGGISIHRLILWFVYYAPMGFFGAILSIPTAIMQSPPALFFAAITLRQVVGNGVLGAAIPEDSGEDGADGAKQNNIEVLSMAKNFVKNFFMTTFPTLVKVYDAYLHLKSDMYVVLCGLFFGLAWTHLRTAGDLSSCLADSCLAEDAVVDAGVDMSEGEL